MVLEAENLRAATLHQDQLSLHELLRHGLEAQWRLAATVQLPTGGAAVSLTGDQQKIVVPGMPRGGQGEVGWWLWSWIIGYDSDDSRFKIHFQYLPITDPN